jgi:hypothetical protein
LAANLAFGELALNYADGKIYYKNSGGTVSSLSGGVTTLSFGTTGLTPSTATAGVITVAGTLVAANGGTSFSTYATGDLIYASAANTLAKLTAGTNGHVLTLAAGVPTWAASTGGVTSFQTSLSGLTPSTATTGVITLAGTLGADSGGTGLTTYAVGDINYASATTPTISKLAIGTANQIMNVNAGATAPQWTGLSSLIDTVFTASAQGTLLYRGASNWVALAPGTATHVLTTGGPGANPSWTAAAGAGVTSISFGSTGLTPNTASTGVVSVAGTLGAGFGGTGLATYTAGDVIYASASTTFTKLGIGTAYQISAVNAGATAPSWQGLSSLIDNALSASTQGQILYRNATTWVALPTGTNGQVLTSGGTGANVSWTTAAGGLTGFTAALNTAAPNATNNVSSITASGGTTNQFIAIRPKGTGGIIAAIPDSTTVGGNVRGINSVDLQTSRTAATQVAQTAYSSIIGGQDNTASDSFATVLGGYGNTASGEASLASGSSSVASGPYSAAFGAYATTRLIEGYKAFAPGAPIAFVVNTNQQGFLVVGAQTTTATATILRSDPAAASATNQLYIPNNSIVTFTILVACGITGASNAKAWEIKGAVKKGSTEATNVLVGALTKNVLAADSGASTWDVAVTANTTTGALTITVTGQAGTTIRWTASIFTSEVCY